MSSAAPDPAATMLVVPIDVVALCIGEVDEKEATNRFAGATAAYSEQELHGALLGHNVTRDLSERPLEQMQKGIHLHWALPDALTHAGTKSGSLEFPAAPNRWLITRFVIDGKTPTATHWLIESDALLSEKSGEQVGVTVPVKKVEFAQGYAYLGRVTEIDDDWRLEAMEPAALLRDHAGTELTAVTNGEVGFAAYYPSCGGALGFYDEMKGLKTPSAADPAEVMYTVSGWYDLEQNDPVQPGATAASLEKEYGWTFGGDASPTGSLYSGVVEGISWSPYIVYVHEQKVQEPIEAEAAIGNDSAEALSAYFAAAEQQPPLFEQILDGFQRGLLDGFKQPEPNQLAKLAESLHDAAFGGFNSGTVHTIVAAEGEEAEAIELPLSLADALNELNLLQQQHDLCAAHVGWFRWQLFADWYRIFMEKEEKQNAAFTAAGERYGVWPELEKSCAGIVAALKQQVMAVEAQLGAGLKLKSMPAARYQQPSDPVLLLAGEGLEYPSRHGGDGRFDAAGHLVCRTSDRLLSAEEVEHKAITASQFAVAAPGGLAQTELLTALLREACLLNTDLAAALTGASPQDLEAALSTALAGGQSAYSFSAGLPPSPVAVNWWRTGLWLPLFMSWKVEYLPLQPTAKEEAPLSYQPRFFAANYQVDQDAGGAISYAPSGGAGSIKVDPASEAFPQKKYEGDGTLTPSAADTLASQLAAYLEKNTDPTLKAIEQKLESTDFLTAPLNGLTALMLMQSHSIQLQVRANPESNYAELTEEVQPVIGDANRIGPDFWGSFNPIRAGYLKVGAELVDTFGQKRKVHFPQLVCAESMTTVIEGKTVPSIAYLQPRLAQPSRLLFRWLAADSSGREEMNPHPAATPVCGWLLPNHLDGSLFLYNQEGQPLGTLYLVEGEGGSVVEWQSAPGDDATIDEDVATALEFENPRLRALAIALKGVTAEFFTDLWQAIDTVGDKIEPGTLAGDAGLAALVGRPVAVTQASLRLEVQGRPALDRGWDVSPGTDSDAGFSEVALPVVLGNFENLGDGLIGYFKQEGEGYDLATFYTQGAPESSQSGVVRPAQETLELTASPKLGEPEPPDLAAQAQRVLMLIDPRAAVHATTGYLPTASLQLPPDLSSDEVASFDMSFLTTPVLKGASALTLPTPQEAGYQVSWIEETRSGTSRTWTVTPEIEAPPSEALWSYSDQTLSEGWLRLNPMLLDFELLGAGGKPVVTGGATNSLTLHVVNRARRDVTFLAGSPVAEGSKPPGSVFYLHLGALVAQENVAAIQLAATDWAFELFDAPPYGRYWAAAPTQQATLTSGQSIAITVADLAAAKDVAQARIYFDYYHLDGVDDGVSAQTITVQGGSGE